LADKLWHHPETDPESEASQYINTDNGIADSKAALYGARAIIMERIAEDADLLEKVRSHLNRNAHLEARVVAGQEQAGEKFKDYFEHSEA
ncbi:RNA-binding transcriptional accessory protein, partial [Vibrio campbellii]